MTRPWLSPPVPALERSRAAVAATLPRIETARLVLRVPVLSDWDALAPIWTTDRARHIGGPFDEADGWLDFCQMVAGWVLRGAGALTIEDRETGATLGLVSLHHEWGDAEIELGWLLVADAEGKGIAAEAAQALREHAYRSFGLPALVSYVDTANDRSAALARRLGALPDPAAVLTGSNDDGHTIAFRHPRPEPMA